MARLEAMAAWLFTSLGIVLLGVSILVVPADAFADGGKDIPECGAQCTGDPDPENCCKDCCVFEIDPEQCEKDCIAQNLICDDTCEVGTSCFDQSGGVCDELTKFCTVRKICHPMYCKCKNSQGNCQCRLLPLE